MTRFRGSARWLMAAALGCGLSAPAIAQRLDGRTQQIIRDLKAREPSVKQAQQAALAFFKVDADTVSSMRGRATWKAILPEVNVRYRMGSTTAANQSFGLGTGIDEPQGRDDARGDVSEMQVSGTWNLPRLLFNPEVLDVSSAAALQESVIKEVTRLYYARRRVQLDLMLDPPREPAGLLAQELRLEELTATLDALTGHRLRWGLDEGAGQGAAGAP